MEANQAWRESEEGGGVFGMECGGGAVITCC